MTAFCDTCETPVGCSLSPQCGGLDKSKASNPKDAIASKKIPMHLAPATAVMAMVTGLLHGMLRYGRSNWRPAGAKASVYHDAIRRHLDDWFEGNDTDEEGCDNLDAILANVAIIVDARACGKLTDDRQFPGGYREAKAKAEENVARLLVMHAEKSPRHYTIADARQ